MPARSQIGKKTPPLARARDTRTYHDDTTGLVGPEGEDCMLVDGGSDVALTGLIADPPTVASPPSNG